MAWLRIDDGFTRHPKLLALGSKSDRWTWLEVLVYCAQFNTSGELPAQLAEVVPGATPKFVERAVAAGLIDVETDGAMRVHDWKTYNPNDPTAAERMQRLRNKNRNNARNEHRNENVTVTGPRAQERARGPSPKNSPTERALTGSLSPESPSPPTPPRPPTPDGAAVEDLTPDPEGLARIATIWNSAAKKADAERAAELEQNARLDTPQAEARRAAAKAKLAELRANA